jgi:hypothetical protein
MQIADNGEIHKKSCLSEKKKLSLHPQARLPRRQEDPEVHFRQKMLFREDPEVHFRRKKLFREDPEVYFRRKMLFREDPEVYFRQKKPFRECPEGGTGKQ